MGLTKQVFIKLTEEEYNEIPSEIKERFFHSKNITRETNDWAENMLDETYSRIYKEKKEISKQIEEREYQLRENRRKNANNI